MHASIQKESPNTTKVSVIETFVGCNPYQSYALNPILYDDK